MGDILGRTLPRNAKSSLFVRPSSGGHLTLKVFTHFRPAGGSERGRKTNKAGEICFVKFQFFVRVDEALLSLRSFGARTISATTTSAAAAAAAAAAAVSPVPALIEANRNISSRWR